MEFTHEKASNILFLRLTGDLIAENKSVEILRTADTALTEGIKNCIVNIKNVPYINSSGIGVLITLLTKFRNKGGEVFLISPSDHVNKLLIIIKLRNIFNIADSESEAIEKIN